MARPDPPSGTAFDAAVRLLARRAHSRRELARKLSIRGFSREDIDAALTRCDDHGYLNDAALARRLAERLSVTGHGAAYIRHYLREKGLSSEAAGIQESPNGEEEEASARRALEKKLAGSRRDEEPAKRRQRLYRFLLSRGFSGQVALAVVDRCLNEGK